MQNSYPKTWPKFVQKSEIVEAKVGWRNAFHEQWYKNDDGNLICDQGDAPPLSNEN